MSSTLSTGRVLPQERPGAAIPKRNQIDLHDGPGSKHSGLNLRRKYVTQRCLKYRCYALIVCITAFLFAVSPALLLAQGAGASLSGTVVDPAGNVLPTAVVVVKNESTGDVRKATVDAQGHFSLSGLSAGKYTVQVTAPGFAAANRPGLQLTAGQSQDLPISLSIGNAADQVTVEANSSGSIAAALAPVGALLEARSARSEISSEFIQQFTSPVADYGEISQIVPGVYTINSNGIGLGQSATYFRGFPDGDYDITWDGIPFEDTNTPTHHSWAFFPGIWLGGVDFDRSPGSASTIGPSPFGGTINLLSKDVPAQQAVRGTISYGSFNTLLLDAQYDSGTIGANHKTSLVLDVHRLTSDGFQTFNYQQRIGGDIKVQYKFSDRTVLTGFSGVIQLTSNSPNNSGPTRAQAQQQYNFLLQNTDPTSTYYYAYNTYRVPTDFEYVGIRSALGHGWALDVKPYTYNYDNAEYYTNDPPLTADGKIDATCAIPVKKKGSLISPCAVDKYNSYRKYGETSTISQTSKYGIFRTGLWYEWSNTHRHQIPSNPLTHQDDVVPNFNEQYYQNNYQPYAEYELRVIPKLTLTGGYKYAYYNMNFTQFADNGGKIGNLGGKASINNVAGYSSNLPSADANYRIKSNWSVYGQFSKGSIIPPTSVFDVTGGGVQTLPKPTGVSTYQTGSVLKLKRFTLDGDAYYIKFQNSYSSATQTINGVTDTYYFLGPDSVSKGFELETNVYFGYGLSLYANGTANRAIYVGTGIPSNLFVQNSPANTQGYGLTYQAKNLDFGFFEKRIGTQWNDNGAYHSQYNSAPFNIDNLFFNYNVRNNTIFDGTKVSLSFNNLFDTRNIVSIPSFGNAAVALKVNGAASPYLATTALSGGDILTQTPGRSISLTVTFGAVTRR
jgi:iron complex outermembrane recepter protein